MKRMIREFLTRRVQFPVGKRKTIREIELPPSEDLIYCFIFCIVGIAVLSIVEVVHIIYLGSFNESVYTLISTLVGAITGIIIGRKA